MRSWIPLFFIASVALEGVLDTLEKEKEMTFERDSLILLGGLNDDHKNLKAHINILNEPKNGGFHYYLNDLIVKKGGYFVEDVKDEQEMGAMSHGAPAALTTSRKATASAGRHHHHSTTTGSGSQASLLPFFDDPVVTRMASKIITQREDRRNKQSIGVRRMFPKYHIGPQAMERVLDTLEKEKGKAFERDSLMLLGGTWPYIVAGLPREWETKGNSANKR